MQGRSVLSGAGVAAERTLRGLRGLREGKTLRGLIREGKGIYFAGWFHFQMAYVGPGSAAAAAAAACRKVINKKDPNFKINF